MERVYPSRINWQNLPSTATPINETNLNKLDYAVYQIDGRVVDFDITKANQSDLLQTLKSLTYNPTTGVFVFTYWNGGTFTVDLNIEKIPVSFSMSPQGVITMTTADGTQYTCDVAALIKQYTFNDSTEIDFTTTTDASGNKNITASLKSGSITGDKLQPNYLADCVSAKNQAQSAATNASNSAIDADSSSEDAEAWAVGEKNGQPVPSSDPTYHNNSKYWSEQAGSARLVSLQDVQIDNVQDGDALVYDGTSQKWVNGAGSSSADSKITNYEDRGYLGKNLLNPDNLGHGVRDNSTGQITSQSATAMSTTEPVKVLSGKKYTVTRNGATPSVRVFYYDSSKAFISTEVASTFTVPNNASYVAIQSGTGSGDLTGWQLELGSTATIYEPYVKSNIELDATKIDKTASEIQTSDGQFTTVTGGLMQSCVVNFEPIQSGSGTPSPSNVRAISGHTQVQVRNVGKNWLSLSRVKEFNTAGTWSGNSYVYNGVTFTILTNSDNNVVGIRVNGTATNTIQFYLPRPVNLPSGSYVLTGGISENKRIFFYNGSQWYNDVGSGISFNITGSESQQSTVIVIVNGQICNNDVFKPMIRLATEVDPTYEPYKGYPTTINLGGTYYGGTLDAVSGVLTVDKGYAEFDGSVDENWSTRTSGDARLFEITLTNCNVPQQTTKPQTISSNMLQWLLTLVGETYVYRIMGQILSVRIDESITDSLETFRTWLSTNKLQFYYPLATPQTIQLTPTQLETLVGKNDVFAPLVGQTIESVEYREVLAIDDVPKAIPYECVDPIEVEWFTAFKIHKYGRVVVLKFYDLEYSPVASQDGWVTLGKLPERFYHKYPNPTVAQEMIFGVINDDAGTLQMKQLTIEQYGGNVRMYFLANEQIRPLGSITYILDHD